MKEVNMNCHEINIMISEYLDNELTKEREGFLFTHLSSCSDCREELKKQLQIQHQVKLNQKEVSSRFEERIFYSMSNKKHHSPKIFAKPLPAYISYALGFVVVLISLFSYLQINQLTRDLNIFANRYEQTIQQMNYQASQMNLMMNSMPAVNIQQY
jgi:hypothetical protein